MFTSSQSSKSKTKQFSRSGTFADLLTRHVRERGGDAPAIYKAARIDRRTYSSIISHPFRPVAKRTAVQFAIALRLDREYQFALTNLALTYQNMGRRELATAAAMVAYGLATDEWCKVQAEGVLKAK